jgi:hypothetical protein
MRGGRGQRILNIGTTWRLEDSFIFWPFIHKKRARCDGRAGNWSASELGWLQWCEIVPLPGFDNLCPTQSRELCYEVGIIQFSETFLYTNFTSYSVMITLFFSFSIANFRKMAVFLRVVAEIWKLKIAEFTLCKYRYYISPCLIHSYFSMQKFISLAPAINQLSSQIRRFQIYNNGVHEYTRLFPTCFSQTCGHLQGCKIRK